MKKLILTFSLLFLTSLVQKAVYGQTSNYYTFNSQGHAKSLGLNFTIKYPASWEAQEGNRPHIVQKFLNPSAKEIPTFLVLIRDIGTSLSKAEIESELSNQNIKNSIPSGSKFVMSQNKLLIDGQRAASFDYIITRTAQNTTVGKDFQLYTRTYMFFWKSYMIQIQCSVGQTEINDDVLTAKFNTYKSVFIMGANSFILNSKWE